MGKNQKSSPVYNPEQFERYFTETAEDTNQN